MARNQGSLAVPQNRQRGLIPAQRDFLAPAALIAGSPWQLMRRMQEDIDRLFGTVLTGPTREDLPGAAALPLLSPRMDISEDEKEWRIEIDLPGVQKDQIDVQVQNGQLRIRAELRQDIEGPAQDQQRNQPQQRQYHRRERLFGYFEQVFPLPDNVDEEAIRCEYRDGVLICHLPKAAQANQAGRSLPIGDGATAQTSAQSQTSGQSQASGQATGSAQPQPSTQAQRAEEPRASGEQQAARQTGA